MVKDAASGHNQRTASAISSARPIRPIGSSETTFARRLRERRRADRYHTEHSCTNTGQLQQLASTDRDADLVFDEPPCFELRVHV